MTFWDIFDLLFAGAAWIAFIFLATLPLSYFVLFRL